MRTRFRSLASALSRNSLAVVAAQASYQDDVNQVANAMATVMSQPLPTLNTQPTNWGEITAAYAQANEDTMTWTNQVYGQLASAPADVQNYNTIISGLFADAMTQTNALIANPGNTTANALLNTDLSTLASTLSLVNIFVMGALTSINTFGSSTLTDDANQLTTVVNGAYTDASIDQALITQLQQDIRTLKADIIALDVQLGIDSAAVVGGGILLVASCLTADPVGAIVGALALAGGITGLALDSVDLMKDQDELAQDQEKLSSVEADYAALTNTATNFTTSAQTIAALTPAVTAISTAWQALETDMTGAISDIAAATAAGSTDDYQQIYNDLTAASTCWTEAYADAGSLAINIQGNTAPLAIGDDAATVSAKVAATATVDFVTYINNYYAVTAPVAAAALAAARVPAAAAPVAA